MIGTKWMVGVVFGVVVLASAGCASSSSSSSDDATTEQRACGTTPATTTSKDRREVSFQREVAPIFRASCAFGSCHGAPGKNGIYLGAGPASAFVGKPSTQVPRMAYVKPGAPDESYLVRKIEGAFCGLPCEGNACGERMPRGGDPLDAVQQDTIRAWILSGAKDD